MIINEESEPAKFISEELQFEFLTTDVTLVGEAEYSLRAWLADYESLQEVRPPTEVSATITITDVTPVIEEPTDEETDVVTDCSNAEIVFTDWRFGDIYYYYRDP